MRRMRPEDCHIYCGLSQLFFCSACAHLRCNRNVIRAISCTFGGCRFCYIIFIICRADNHRNLLVRTDNICINRSPEQSTFSSILRPSIICPGSFLRRLSDAIFISILGTIVDFWHLESISKMPVTPFSALLS